jgi:hypothetical protein
MAAYGWPSSVAFRLTRPGQSQMLGNGIPTRLVFSPVKAGDENRTDPDKISANGAEFTQSVAQNGAPVSVSLTLQ